MTKRLMLIAVLLIVSGFTPAFGQETFERRPALIVELGNRLTTADPIRNAQRVDSFTFLAGVRPRHIASLHDFEELNAPLLKELDRAELRRMGRWVRIETNSETELDYLRTMLDSTGLVKQTYRAPTPVPAVAYTPAPAPANAGVPDFNAMQGYFRPAPLGMDVDYAQAALADSDVRVVFGDVEAGWNKNHFDIPLKNKNVSGLALAANTSWYPHGTAVVGIVAGRDNGQGVKGIAPDSKVRLYSVFRRQENRIFDNVPGAIIKAAQEMKKGSVLLLEIQYNNIEGVPSYVPVEYFLAEFEAIQFAIKRGLIVVEVAGNGGLNLDVYLIRDENGDVPDSGAIMVGAGGVPNNFNKGGKGENLRTLWFSNYGSRINVQNWGEYVVTTGYGDLANGPSARNHNFTAEFNGTSSAGAVTAGACVLIQEYAITTLGRPLTNAEMRDLLIETGTAQLGNSNKEHIGPRPNLRAVFQKIDTMVN